MRMKMKGIGVHRLLLLVGLVGLALIVGATASYGQTQKALIDLNKASDKELETLKGIGPAMSKKIIAGRPYKAVDDLVKAGIPAKTVESIKPLVTVGTPATSVAPAKAAAPPAPAKAAAKEAPAKAASAPSPVAPEGKATAKAVAPTKLAPGQKVNLNTATKEQLEALPQIGPVKAQAIIEGCPYKKAEDVMKVKGIKEGIYGKIKDMITVN